MTPKEQMGLFFHAVGYLLIALGLFVAWMNWRIIRHQTRFARGEVERNSSLAPLLGFALPLGFLCFPLLRIHALWVWLLDPCSALLIFSVPVWLWQKLTRSTP